VPEYYEEEEESSSYYEEEENNNYYEEEEENNYYEEEESSYYYEEEEESSYYEEEESSYGSYNMGGSSTYYSNEQPSYVEEYEEYEEESYNYNSPSYSGNTYSYGGNSSYGYGSSSGYSGSYDSSSSSSNQPMFPSALLTGFVVDVHFLAGDTTMQYIAWHYCSDLFPGYTQCAIYNGTDSNSRLIATEIVVSAEIFTTLPMSERMLWHSHAFAVSAGILVLPGVPESDQLAAYQSVMGTYGKVVDYWHYYQTFPLGPPRLAYGLAAEIQINVTILEEMDKMLNVGSTWQQRKQQRASLKMPEIIEGADSYLTSGEFPQYVIEEFQTSSSSSSSSSSNSGS